MHFLNQLYCINIVQLYKLPLRVAKINIFDGKLKLEISDTYINTSKSINARIGLLNHINCKIV